MQTSVAANYTYIYSLIIGKRASHQCCKHKLRQVFCLKISVSHFLVSQCNVEPAHEKRMASHSRSKSKVHA